MLHLMLLNECFFFVYFSLTSLTMMVLSACVHVAIVKFGTNNNTIH